MKRLTSNNYHEMDMVQLALNQVYIEDNWAWYVNGQEDHISVCDLIRSAAEPLGVELPILGDYELSDVLADWLQYGTEEPEGVLAITYRALWAMAEIRSKLSRYEDTGLEPDDVTDLQRAWDMYGGEEGITALFRKPPNAPLTLDELRGMDGEPVYIVPINDPYIESEWGLVHIEWLGCKTWGGGAVFFDRYGEWWLAYRRKPEEDDRVLSQPTAPGWAEHLKARFLRTE